MRSFFLLTVVIFSSQVRTKQYGWKYCKCLDFKYTTILPRYDIVSIVPRYPKEGGAKFRNIYDIQTLNYVFELLQEKGKDSSRFEAMLEDLASASHIDSQGYLTVESQRKSGNLRRLEYLSFIPSCFNHDRAGLLHTRLREHDGYDAFLAKISKAIESEYRRMRQRSQSDPKSKGLVALRIGSEDPFISLESLQREISNTDWIVLPTTPITNYPGGIKLALGLGTVFLQNLRRMLPQYSSSMRLLGLVNSGQDEDGSVIVEASMLYNRFLLGTEEHSSVVGYLSRLLYEAILLPRLIQHPNRLLCNSNGIVVRRDGVPVYGDDTYAKRISVSMIENLPPLRFLAHSSGIATMQQIDNAMRQDMQNLGFSKEEQTQIFSRNVVVSFGSAADINMRVSGTPTVDITAYNDVRSMAGTTTSDYYIDEQERRRCARACLSQGDKYRYDNSSWVLVTGIGGKTMLRCTGVFLREDHLRQHDGHSIQRYLEGAPNAIAKLLQQLHSSSNYINLRDNLNY